MTKVPPNPPPRFDDVYFEGTEYLDSLARGDEPQPAPPGEGAPVAFEYLLNRMENAASHETPADHGYYEARLAVFEYVARLRAELDEARTTIEISEFSQHHVTMRAEKAERERDEARRLHHEQVDYEVQLRAERTAAEADAARLREALRQLRGDANRLCDRNLGGTYEEDCRRAIAVADAALAATEEEARRHDCEEWRYEGIGCRVCNSIAKDMNLETLPLQQALASALARAEKAECERDEARLDVEEQDGVIRHEMARAEAAEADAAWWATFWRGLRPHVFTDRSLLNSWWTAAMVADADERAAALAAGGAGKRGGE